MSDCFHTMSIAWHKALYTCCFKGSVNWTVTRNVRIALWLETHIGTNNYHFHEGRFDYLLQNVARILLFLGVALCAM